MSKYHRPEGGEALAGRYEGQARTQRSLVRDLQRVRGALERLENGFRCLLTDEHFMTLVRAEGLDRVPHFLVNRNVPTGGGANCSEIGVSEVDRLIRSKKLSPTTRYELARMVPARQEEFARLMFASGCFISPYVRALVGASDRSLLANPRGRPRLLVMKSPQREIASKEITELAGQLGELSKLNGADLILLFTSARYAKKLLGNRRVSAYLKRRWPEVLNELENTVRSHLGSETFSVE
jgi:hypothetical protein